MNRRRVLAFLSGVGVAAIVLTLTFSLVKTLEIVSVVRETQKQNTPISKSSHSILTIIRDCTTPAGACYKRTVAQNRQTIDSINEVSVYAATCAKRYETVASIEGCVLAFIHDRPQPKLDRSPTPSSSRPRATGSPPASPKADRGSGPAKHKTGPPSSKPTIPTKPTKPTPPPVSPSPPVTTPTPGLCLLGLVCLNL